MGLKTVERIGPLLDLFTIDQQVWELGDIAAELHLPRSTVHGLLSSLVSTGLLASPARGVYELGDRVAAMNSVINQRLDVRAAATSPLHELADRFGETVNLGCLRGEKIMYLDKVAGRHAVTVLGLPVGSVIDARRSAMGKAMIAASLQTGEGAQAKNLSAIRRQGFAVDMGAYSPEVRCISSPVRGPRGEAVAAISISTTPMRFERAKSAFAEAIVESARAIEHRLAV